MVLAFDQSALRNRLNTMGVRAAVAFAAGCVQGGVQALLGSGRAEDAAIFEAVLTDVWALALRRLRRLGPFIDAPFAWEIVGPGRG